MFADAKRHTREPRTHRSREPPSRPPCRVLNRRRSTDTLARSEVRLAIGELVSIIRAVKKTQHKHAETRTPAGLSSPAPHKNPPAVRRRRRRRSSSSKNNDDNNITQARHVPACTHAFVSSVTSSSEDGTTLSATASTAVIPLPSPSSSSSSSRRLRSMSQSPSQSGS